jgi:CubicO group peptidase (beta-lactamase class C family)
LKKKVITEVISWFTFIFIISNFLLLTSHAGDSQMEVDQDIAKIEGGLLKTIQLAGKPKEKLNLQERMRFYRVPGLSIAVIRDGKVFWKKAYGTMDIETGKPVTTDTLFQAASISKTLTAVAALKAVSDGHITLDEDVNQRLVSWKIPESKFTKDKKKPV